jgi:hypothetical protein
VGDEARADSIVAEWLRGRSRGEALDPGAVIRDHPDQAEPLQTRFAAPREIFVACEEQGLSSARRSAPARRPSRGRTKTNRLPPS